MRDQKSMEVPGLWRPSAHPRAGTRPVQIDRTARTLLVTAAIYRKMPFMCAPAQFSRLRAFADEAVDRPGVDELVRHLRHVGDLGVPFSDMNDFDAARLRQLRPALATARRGGIHTRVLGDV